jgi:hypothetical protein
MTDFAWYGIIFGVINCVGSIYAIFVSHSAKNNAANDKHLADKITIALSNFRQELLRELVAVFVNRELYEERFKAIDLKFVAVDKELAGLDHRLTRNINLTSQLIGDKMERLDKLNQN